MKKTNIILISLYMVLLVTATVYAATLYTQHTLKTASANITASPGYLSQVLMKSDGASTTTFNLYDSAGTGTTTEMFITLSVTTSETPNYFNIPFNPPVEFFKGLYFDLSSTGEAMIFWGND